MISRFHPSQIGVELNENVIQGRDFQSNEWKSTLQNFILAACKDDVTHHAMQRMQYEPADLYLIYEAMVVTLMPTPFANYGGISASLVANIVFLESRQLEHLLGQMHVEVKNAPSSAERNAIIAARASAFARLF